MKQGEIEKGDIIARIDNRDDRYVVIGFNECNGRKTWRGINAKGQSQGGTLMGSWNWDEYAKVGHMDLSILDQINRGVCETTITAKDGDDKAEIHNCPEEVWQWVVCRGYKGNWYHWADFRHRSVAEKVADDIREYNKGKTDNEVRVMSADYRWVREDLSSHSERDILDGCIALMQELNDRFLDYLDFMDVEPEYEESRWCTFFSYFEIVQRLFLWRTGHSGGTCTRLKIAELGLDDPADVIFEMERSDEEDEEE